MLALSSTLASFPMDEYSSSAEELGSFEAIRLRVIEALVEFRIIKHESDILMLTIIDEGFLNYLFMLKLAGRELVVKYADPQSRKYHGLNLPLVRLRQEARAINWVAKNMDSSCVPRILCNRENMIIMHRIPTDYRALRTLLSEGDFSVEVAKQLGTFLGRLHNMSAASGEVRNALSDISMLVEFKFRKIYDEVARNFAIAPQIDNLKKQLLGCRICLVHGDFKADNIFIRQHSILVIDWEQAHFGNPALDLSYVIHYLVILSCISEEISVKCGRFIESLVERYLRSVVEFDAKRYLDLAAKHIGVLVLFRIGEIERVITGVSNEAKSRLHAVATALIEGRASSLPLSF
jgi:5-methylthioribose kinase